MPKMKASVQLYLESSSDYRITLIKGKISTTVSVDTARILWEAGEVDDWNLAFDRLAKQYNFDLDALKAYYQGKRAQVAQ